MGQTTRGNEFWLGARDTLPLIVGAIPFGIIFGTLAGGVGLCAAGTLGMSLFVFAGSAQFIAIGLLGAGTAWPMIVLTTLVVNSRHLLYTATLLTHLKKLPMVWQLILAFGLTDETFTVSINRWYTRSSSPFKHWYQLGSMVFMYANWNLCTVIGYFAGRMLQQVGGWGLDFAMIAAFIGMVIPYLTSKPVYAAVFTSGLCALALHGLPYKMGLMFAAVLGMAVGVMVERRLEHQAPPTDNASSAPVRKKNIEG